MKPTGIEKILAGLPKTPQKNRKPARLGRAKEEIFPGRIKRLIAVVQKQAAPGKKPEKELNKEKEDVRAGEEHLKGLARDNQLLVNQLVKASSILRTLEERFYETSRKQTMGKVMVAGLLHDLRNPLTVISSCAQFCMDIDEIAPSIKEKLEMILTSAKKANDLTKKFLDYAKSSVLDYKPVDLNRILLVMWKMCELESAPCQVNFEARLEKDLPEIIGSQENIERVFLNLFMNAIHAVSKRGKIIVETSLLPSEEMVEIRIIDDGAGIPKEQFNRIFEPFHTTREDGIGLGLSICQSIIQQHKGSISIDSEEGKGTMFSIKLPIRQDEPLPPLDKNLPFE